MDLSKKWFILQFKPNSHRLAERNLHARALNRFFHARSYQTQIQPLCQRSTPLFPGYMFVAFDPTSGPWRQINCTIGVSKLVSFGGQPSPVPLDLISGLMLRCNAGGKLLPPKQLNKDDAVQLLTGPFANYIAKVETIDANNVYGS